MPLMRPCHHCSCSALHLWEKWWAEESGIFFSYCLMFRVCLYTCLFFLDLERFFPLIVCCCSCRSSLTCEWDELRKKKVTSICHQGAPQRYTAWWHRRIFTLNALPDRTRWYQTWNPLVAGVSPTIAPVCLLMSSGFSFSQIQMDTRTNTV